MIQLLPKLLVEQHQYDTSEIFGHWICERDVRVLLQTFPANKQGEF